MIEIKSENTKEMVEIVAKLALEGIDAEVSRESGVWIVRVK